MNKTGHTYRLRMVASLSVILGVGILLVGCPDQPDTVKAPVTTVETETPAKELTVMTTPDEAADVLEGAPAAEEVAEVSPPAPARPTPTPTVLDETEADDDFAALYALQQEYKQGAEQSEAVDRDFDSKWQAITKGMKPRTLIEGLDFLAVKTKATGEQEYTFSFLLRPTADLDTNYHLTVLGSVFGPNAQFLPEAQRERMYAGWNRVLNDDPTSQWKRGECHVVHLKAKTDSLIPYNLQLFLHTRTEQNKWASNVETRLSLGWQWDIPDGASFLAKIEACGDFEELYALAPAGPKLPTPMAQAVEKKWKALTAGMSPQNMIEGLDLLDLDTRATGDEEYTFTVLLQSTEDLADDYRYYHLSVVGLLDQSHMRLANPGKKYISWALLFYDNPMSQWKSGDYHVAQLKAPIGRIVPLDIQITLEKRNAQRRSEGSIGDTIRLGWRTDLSK